MDNPLGDFKDEVEEVAKETTRGIVKEAKKQIIGEEKKKDKDRVDPTTGKPVPTKKTLTQLTQATAQLQQTKLKKLREELDKQRLKIIPPEKKVEMEAKKEKFDVVAQTLKNSESTGEFGRQVGG